MMETIAVSIKEGVKVYDLLGGDRAYKEQFNVDEFERRDFDWTKYPLLRHIEHHLSSLRAKIERNEATRRIVYVLMKRLGK